MPSFASPNNFPHSQSAKARLKVQEQDLKALNWEHEVLEQRFKQVCVTCGNGGDYGIIIVNYQFGNNLEATGERGRAPMLYC